MKKLLPLVFVFLFLTSGIIVLASVTTSVPVYLPGLSYVGSTRILVLKENNAQFSDETCYEIPSSVLQDSTSLTVTFNNLSSSCFYTLCYSSNRIPPDLTRDANYYNFPTTSVASSRFYPKSGANVLDLTRSSYVDDVYYYLFTSGYPSGDIVVNLTSDKPAPTPTPSSAPTSFPSSPPSGGSGTSLDDYTFWSYCYDQTIKNGSTSSRTATHRFVPSAMSDISGEAKYNYLYTYPVRIPFRVEASKFHGVGYFDANFKFDFDYEIFGQDSSPYPNFLVDYSSPWIESTDPLSFNATLGNKYGNGFDVINVPLHNGTSSEFYFCFDMYVSISSNSQLSGFADYVDVNLDNISFKVTSSTKVSDTPSEDILGQIRDEQKNQNEIDNEHYQQEQDKIAEAEGAITDGAGQLTDLLSGWEIFTMPFQLVKDFVGAISSDGDSGLTFPSFTLMGQQLWPSYTFDLKTVSEKFPVLYNALHVMTGIMVVRWFISYCWRKWRLFTGDDMPEEG